MIDHKNITSRCNVRLRTHLERLSLFIILDLKILATIIECIREFKVERFDQMRWEIVAQQLHTMELIKSVRLGGKALNGIVWD